jgi:hypothetical protein
MKDFFVSYNKADRAWAEWIAWQLEEAGYSTVIQAWDFRPGSNFVLEMHRAAQEAERTVAVLSPDYLQALYTQPEWTAAFAQDPMGGEQKLLPVRVRECELKGLLGQVIYIDLVRREEDVARDELLKGVSSDRAKPASPPSFPGAFPHSLSERPPFPGARASSASIESHNLLNPLIMKVVERIAKSLWPDEIARMEWCAVPRHGLSVGESPTRPLSLRPVATGANMEVTKRSKPSRQRVVERSGEHAGRNEQ